MCRRASRSASRSAACSCARTVRVVNRPASSPVARSCNGTNSWCSNTFAFTADRSAAAGRCFARCRSRSRSVKVALLRVSVASTWSGSRAAASFAWRSSSARSAIPDSALRMRTGPMCWPACVAVGSTRRSSPCSWKYRFWWSRHSAPQACAVGHDRPAAGAPHLRVQVPRLLRREVLSLDPPGGDQQVRVPVRPLRLLRPLVRRVHVELHRQALRHEVLRGERPRQLDPVLVVDPLVGRQGEHDLAGDLRVLAFLGRLRRVPQYTGVRETARPAPSGSSTS